jgi:hypothetical protein
MKKSEALADIASEIVLSGFNNGLDISWDKARNMADQILSKIELIGMAPPSVPTLTVFETVIREERIWEEENG